MVSGQPYKIICISMYEADLDRLDAFVSTLKGDGFRTASRSAVIRAALKEAEPSRVTKHLRRSK